MSSSCATGVGGEVVSFAENAPQAQSLLSLQRIPCLDSAAFSAFKPSDSLENRTISPFDTQIRFSYPHMACQPLAQSAQDMASSSSSYHSLHVPDEILFKDAAPQNTLPMEQFDSAIRPVSPLWMMDAQELAEEIKDQFVF